MEVAEGDAEGVGAEEGESEGEDEAEGVGGGEAEGRAEREGVGEMGGERDREGEVVPVGDRLALLADKKVKVALSDGAREWMAEHGYEPEFGARPMGRLVDQAIKKQLAEALLFGALKHGGVAHFDVKADKSGIEPTFTTAEA